LDNEQNLDYNTQSLRVVPR